MPDFRLQKTSPCINAGVVIAGVNDGYRSTAPDIGALEHIVRPRPSAGVFAFPPL